MDDGFDLRQSYLGADTHRRRPVHSRARGRRIERARRRLRWAYSPLRLLMLIGFAPVVAAGMATSIYVSSSPFAPSDALAHVVAMGGCKAAAVVGVAPAGRGAPGYHARLDPDGDGQTCQPSDQQIAEAESSMPGDATGLRLSGGAKFLRTGQ